MAMGSTQARSGGCLCGAVRYEAPHGPLSTLVCHCRDCQKQGGGAMSVIAVYRRADVRIEGALRAFESFADSGETVIRWFCGGCGSPIYSETAHSRAKNLVLIKAGTFDDISDLKPTTHFWASSAQPWLAFPSGADVRERQ